MEWINGQEQTAGKETGGKSFYGVYTKPILDRTAACLLLLICLIPMVCMTVLIRLDSPGPALFLQERIGKSGKPFLIWKFRSMEQDAERKGSGVYSEKGDPRVTRIGRILRMTSLDELPQLVNILKGEMSFVGPRPPLLYHPWPYECYTEEQKKMFKVLPGITGWAQIHGRKNLEWNRRIELNVWYTEHVSFFLDLQILVRTVGTVWRWSDNVNQEKTVK